MINIISEKGDMWSWDEDKHLIYKNDQVVSTVVAEPVFSNPFSKKYPPIFAGILLKDVGRVLTLSGTSHPVIDPNTVL